MKPSYPNIKVAITMGDPSGIGPEVILKSLPEMTRLAGITLIGDGGVFARLGRRPDRIKGVDFLDLENVTGRGFRFGKTEAQYGSASIAYLDRALALIRTGKADCLVTAPVSKEAVNACGLKFYGHTEYLREKTSAPFTVMMLLNRYLKFSLLTRHVPLCRVPAMINAGGLSHVIRTTQAALKELFAVARPRIVVCGLNPHASDNGVIGNEENRLIKPLLRRLQKLPGRLDGPFACDAAVARAYAGSYDAVIAMYHDQALLPLKITAPYGGVNLTLGLPFIRTSPLHGTAFDIAGRGVARPESMLEAVRLAVECSANRKKISRAC